MAQPALVDVNTEQPDDVVLAGRARTDTTAFLALYDRYAPRIGRYVASRIGTGPAVEDVISFVFLQALANIGSYDASRGSVGAWLFGIARNAVNRYYRAPRSVPLIEEADRRLDAGLTPEEYVVREEGVARLRAAVTHLRVEQQEALALRYLGELSFTEIAQALGRSEGAAKMLVRRGLDALRQVMRDEEMQW